MVARALIIVLVNAAFLVGVLWYLPIDGLLAARGYTPAQIAALKSANPGEEQTQITATPPPTPSDNAPANEAGAAESDSMPATSSTTAAPPQAVQPDAQPAVRPTPTQSQTEEAAAPAQPEPVPPQRLTATDTINVRAGQGTDHEVVGQVSAGDVVTVLDDPGGDWIRIEHDDTQGWAYRPLFQARDASPE